jgi:hypothetical protein
MQGFAIRQNILNTKYGWENVFLMCRIPMLQNGNGSFMQRYLMGMKKRIVIDIV